MRVLFWGTPEFAAPPLRALLGEGFDVVCIVTQPDRPVGRSRSTVQPSPIKSIGVAERIPVLQPERPRGAEFVAQIREMAPDISVVVAYGHILPQDVIDLPPLGTLNIHASLLPALRGAGPIQAAIREGYVETGATIMRMVPALDAGPMLLSVSTPIYDDETAGELAQRLAEAGAGALIETLSLIEMGAAREVPQDNARATYAMKITREMTRIDWHTSATAVSRTIRAYDPKPGAFSSLAGRQVKLFGARGGPPSLSAHPGQVVLVEEQGMVIGCGEGTVHVTDVWPEGKTRMSAAEWQRGRGITPGAQFDPVPTV